MYQPKEIMIPTKRTEKTNQMFHNINSKKWKAQVLGQIIPTKRNEKYLRQTTWKHKERIEIENSFVKLKQGRPELSKNI